MAGCHFGCGYGNSRAQDAPGIAKESWQDAEEACTTERVQAFFICAPFNRREVRLPPADPAAPP